MRRAPAASWRHLREGRVHHGAKRRHRRRLHCAALKLSSLSAAAAATAAVAADERSGARTEIGPVGELGEAAHEEHQEFECLLAVLLVLALYVEVQTQQVAEVTRALGVHDRLRAHKHGTRPVSAQGACVGRCMTWKSVTCRAKPAILDSACTSARSRSRSLGCLRVCKWRAAGGRCSADVSHQLGGLCDGLLRAPPALSAAHVHGQRREEALAQIYTARAHARPRRERCHRAAGREHASACRATVGCACGSDCCGAGSECPPACPASARAALSHQSGGRQQARCATAHLRDLLLVAVLSVGGGGGGSSRGLRLLLLSIAGLGLGVIRGQIRHVKVLRGQRH
jgi:hypothetical protein